MLVRTIAPHENTHGDTYQKRIGKQYEVDAHEGANLIASGLVEEVKKTKEKSNG